MSSAEEAKLLAIDAEAILAQSGDVDYHSVKQTKGERGFISDHDRISLALSIMRVKDLFFRYPYERLKYMYGRPQLERMVDFLRRANRLVKENGWMYHVPQPYQLAFHKSRKRHRCVFGGNRCLPVGTKVMDAWGSFVNIESLTVGTQIMGCDGETASPCRVRKAFPPRLTETYQIVTHSFCIEASANHVFPLYVPGRCLIMIEAGKLHSLLGPDRTDKIYLARPKYYRPFKDEEDPFDFSSFPTQPAQILSVHPVGSKECIDIMVDNESNLFVMENFVMTHNSGKTLGGVYEAACFAMGRHPYKPDLYIPPKCKVMVSGQSMKTVRETINPYLFGFLPQREIADIRYLRNDVIDFIEMEGGRRIVFASYDQGRKRFQGYSCFAYHLDEEPPEDIYQEVLMRLIDTKGYLWMTLTPLSGLSWVYYTLYQNPDADPEYEDYHWYTEDNRTIDLREVNRVFDKLPEDIRRARARGEFVGASGIIYPWLQTDLAYCDPFDIPERWQLFRVIDPSVAGVTACLWAALDPYNNLWLYREYYQKGRTASEHCRAIQQLSGHETYVLDLIDGQSLAAQGDNLETAYHQYQAGLSDGAWAPSPLVPFTDKKIEDGIYSVWEYMKAAEIYVAGQEPDRPYLRVFADLYNFRNEARRYRWQTLQSGSAKGMTIAKPINKDDHLMDCLRYLCHFSPRFEYVSPVKKADRPKRFRDKLTNY